MAAAGQAPPLEDTSGEVRHCAAARNSAVQSSARASGLHALKKPFFASARRRHRSSGPNSFETACLPAASPRLQVVFCGASDFDTIWSGTRNEKYNDIHRPSRISVLQGKKVSLVASGPSAAHSVIVAEDGCYTFGFNKWGQLGHGDGGWPTQWRVPRKLPLRDVIVAASCGKTHTMLLATNGRVWVMGGNDYGQLGAGHKKPLKEPYMLSGIPTIDRVAVGQDFSAMLTTEGRVLACGKPEYGQLGNGTNGEYFITASKLDFHCETRPILVEGAWLTVTFVAARFALLCTCASAPSS
jgi:hypothetical protein